VTLPERLRSRLAPLADPDRAAAQQAYLKTDQPMVGVTRPVFRQVVRALMREAPPADRSAWAGDVASLWAGPERDLRYAAVAWLTGFRGRFLDTDAVPLVERMIREGAWWDLVDEIAADGLGPIVLRNRAHLRPTLERWIDDPDVWIARAALICQLKHRERTDVAMLLDFCARRAEDRTFWIRKAIGWALRQHARVDPGVVRSFLASPAGARLSALSRREAGKHL
jgi:3-methyladenine DNA glycosylase AlkD